MEDVHELSLTIVSSELGKRCIDNVQEALDEYMHGEVVELREPCAHCGLRNGRYRLGRSCSLTPDVLLVCLKRWELIFVDGVLQEERCLNHDVRASDPLVHGGQTYRLCSSVLHLGSNPNSGHYVAVARHETTSGSWWLYDDQLERWLASTEQVEATGRYAKCNRKMKSYLLFYEKT